MYHLKSRLNDSEYAPQPLNEGKKRGKSKPTERHQTRDAMTATQLSLFPLLNQQSSTPESVVEVKKPTLIDRLSFLSLVTEDVKSSKTSGVNSTLKGKGLSPYGHADFVRRHRNGYRCLKRQTMPIRIRSYLMVGTAERV
jgi:hypothetical protein